MYILDTDTLTYLHAGHSGVAQRLWKLDDPDVRTTIITKIELLRGRFDYALKAETGSQLLKAHHLLTRTEEALAQSWSGRPPDSLCCPVQTGCLGNTQCQALSPHSWLETGELGRLTARKH